MMMMHDDDGYDDRVRVSWFRWWLWWMVGGGAH